MEEQEASCNLNIESIPHVNWSAYEISWMNYIFCSRLVCYCIVIMWQLFTLQKIWFLMSVRANWGRLSFTSTEGYRVQNHSTSTCFFH